MRKFLTGALFAVALLFGGSASASSSFACNGNTYVWPDQFLSYNYIQNWPLMMSDCLAQFASYASTASTGATTATTQAGIATTQAATATTQAGNASTSASAASGSASSAATSASLAGSNASSIIIASSTGGTANAQTVTSVSGLWTNTTNHYLSYVAGATNTGAMTLAVDGQTAKNVYKHTPTGPAALTGGEISTTTAYLLIYDGTEFQIVSSWSTVADLALKAQVMTGGIRLTPYSIGTVTSGTTTLDSGNNPAQWFVNGGASTLAAPANDGSFMVEMINGPGFGTLTFSGFTVGANTGDIMPAAVKETASVTVTSASPGVITYTGHGLLANAPVYFTAGTIPTGLSAGVVYYVTSPTTNTFQVAATPGGTAINTSSTGATVVANAASVADISIFRINGISTYIVKALQ